MKKLKIHAKLKRQNGVALIEAALALPVMLFVVFALIQYTLTLSALVILNNSVTEAARITTVYRPNSSTANYEAVASDALVDLLPDFTNNFKSNVNAQVSSFACGDTTCVRLSLVYPNYSDTPLVPNFFMVPLPDELRAESVTKVEPDLL